MVGSIKVELSRAEVLEAERAVNERYLRNLKHEIANSARPATLAPSSANTRWVGDGPRSRLSDGVLDSLVGRVGFLVGVGGLETAEHGFYIGPWHGEWRGADGHEVLVVSWAAPAAALFYRRDGADDAAARLIGAQARPGIAREIFAGVRTFEQRANDIETFEDDVVANCPPLSIVFPLAGPGTVQVPTAPTTVVRPPRRRQGSITTGSASQRPEQPAKSNQRPARTPESEACRSRASSGVRETAALAPVDGTGAAVPSEAQPAIRAQQIVRAAVEAPRTGRLGSLIATLQEDQYELISWPRNKALVVQGGPGTGKTIIATHRAAWLTHPERREDRLKAIGLIGPTEEWASHVSASIEALGVAKQHCTVMSLPSMLGELAGVQPHDMKPGRETRFDSSWELGIFLDVAVSRLKKRRGAGLRVSDTVKALTTRDVAIRQLLDADPETAAWLREARSWEVMRSHLRYLPALATIGRALGDGTRGETFDHILVDEAQDLRPLEWRLVDSRLGRTATMTLFGDLNQRRSDLSASSWYDLAVDLELTDASGKIDVLAVDLAYRSTRRILKFAGGLLPSGERALRCLRDGTDPVVRKVATSSLVDAACDEAITLSERQSAGLIAIISPSPKPISDAFRARGWRRPASLKHGWGLDGHAIQVLHPDLARGLEFDGVVVVEPADFPENLGRIGSLYTSLTRATKELTVVHARALPKALRLPRKKRHIQD